MDTALLEEALTLAEHYDVEGFYPILQTWKAQRLWTQGHTVQLSISELNISNVPHQKIRCLLNLANYFNFIEQREQAILLANEALQLANQCRFRYYSYRASLLLALLEQDRSRHKLNADSLSKTLRAPLSSEDEDYFLRRNEASAQR